MEIKRPDTQVIRCAVEEIISQYDDITREGLRDTPERVAKMYNELLVAEEPKIKLFSSNGFRGMIKERGIRFYSLCEHHMLPFFGFVDIYYVPSKWVIGLSKLARVVEYFSKRLNIQEEMTKRIGDYLFEKLRPKYIKVVIRARHLCKEMRGIKKNGIFETIYERRI